MNRLKILRKLYSETQEQLGIFLGVTKATICKYEAGEIEISNDFLLKLADHYNVTTDYLLGRTNEKINEPIAIAAKMKDGLDISDMGENDKKVIMDLYNLLKSKKENK